jgi:hypothetical protein
MECIFRADQPEVRVCAHCGAARFTGKKANGTAFYHFPLADTLKMQWAQWESWSKECYYPWEGHRGTPEEMTDLYDGRNWKQHQQLKEPGNMGLILNADGMSIFKTGYSLWPILLMNANLPPELR